MENKGAISIDFLIKIILLVVGFAILLFLYFQFFSFGHIDREVCHTSVIIRATLPTIAQKYVPLKCPTQKICVTGKRFGKGECSEFENEENVVAYRVSNSEKGLNQVQKLYADEMIACWSMMGEGKVDVFPDFITSHFGVGTTEPSCMICSRIALDKDNLDKVGIEYMDLSIYMQTHKAPGQEESYTQFISNEEHSATLKLNNENYVFKLNKAWGDDDDETGLEGTITYGEDYDDDDFGETAIMFMQITGPPSYTDAIQRDVEAVIGVSAISFVTAPIKTTKVAVGLAKSYIVLFPLAVAGIYQGGSIAYNRGVTASYCGDVPTSTSDSKSSSIKGCSVVRTINYDVEDILQYCKVIESIP